MSNSSDFIIENGVLIKFVGIEGDVVIPKGVTDIDCFAFAWNKSVINLTIPEGVTRIDDAAFLECESLERITIPSSIAYVGDAFEDCNNLKSISACSADIYNQVYRSLSKETKNNILTEALVSKSEEEYLLAKIKANMDWLIDIAIGEDDVEKAKYIISSVKKISLDKLNAFIEKSANAPAVKTFLIAYKNRAYSVKAQERIAETKIKKELGQKPLSFAEWKKIFSLEETKDKGYIITGYKGTEAEFVIPQVINDKKVFAISEKAFAPDVPKIRNEVRQSRLNLSTVVIPDSVRIIGAYAFSGCKSLATVHISNGVINIGEGAFYGCENLTCITLPDSVATIEKDAFRACTKLPDINIPQSVTEIKNSAFYGCEKLETVSLPENLKAIEELAFSKCGNLKNISIPEGTNIIAYNAFKDCKSMADESGFVIIQNELVGYYGNSKDVIIPKGIKAIGQEAFSGCMNITSVTLPRGIKAIGNKAFNGCVNLKNIDIPDTVRSIGFWGFGYCKRLSDVVFHNDNTHIEQGAFDGCEHLVIRAAKGSTIESYAKKNRFPFVAE